MLWKEITPFSADLSSPLFIVKGRFIYLGFAKTKHRLNKTIKMVDVWSEHHSGFIYSIHQEL